MTQDVASDAPAAVLPSTCMLYFGDCLQFMPKLPPACINMIFADLPYKCKNFHSTDCAWDSPIDAEKMWAAFEHLSLDSTTFCFTAAQPFTTEIIQTNRKMFRYCLVWDKVAQGNFVQAKRMPMRNHEDLVFFYKTRGTYNPQMIARDKPRHWRKQLVRKSGSAGVQTHSPTWEKVYTHRHPRSIVVASKTADKDRGMHPTQKPVALLEWLIKTYTNPGDTVLDPVFGSCTTGVACARLGRHFIGIEKDPEYFRIGRERVDAERAKLGLQPCEVNP